MNSLEGDDRRRIPVKVVESILNLLEEQIVIIEKEKQELVNAGYIISLNNIHCIQNSAQNPSNPSSKVVTMGKFTLTCDGNNCQVINWKSRVSTNELELGPNFNVATLQSNNLNWNYVAFASENQLKIVHFQEEHFRELITVDYPSSDIQVVSLIFSYDLLCLQCTTSLYIYQFNGETIRNSIEKHHSRDIGLKGNIFEHATAEDKIELKLIYSIPCSQETQLLLSQNTSVLQSMNSLNTLYPKFHDSHGIKNSPNRNLIMWSKSSPLLSIYNLVPLVPQEEIPSRQIQFATKICCVTLSSSTDILAVGMENGSIVLLDSRTWLTKKWLPKYQTEEQPIQFLHFSFDDHFLLVQLANRKILIYPNVLSNNEEEDVVQVNYFVRGDTTNPLYIVPLEHVLAVAIISSLRMYLFDIRSGTLIAYLPFPSPLQTISFSNNLLCCQLQDKILVTHLGKNLLEAYPNLNSFEVNESFYQYINQTVHYERNKEQVIEKYFSASTTLLGNLTMTTTTTTTTNTITATTTMNSTTSKRGNKNVTKNKVGSHSSQHKTFATRILETIHKSKT